MNSCKRLILGLVFCLVAVHPSAWADGPVSAAKVDALVRPLVDGGWTASAAVGVITPQGSQTFGYGHKGDQASTLPDANTLYEIGSVTKVFTGLLLADMVKRGLVTLDEPVQDLLGDSMQVPKGERPITLVDLATHSSGLPRLPSNLVPLNPENPYADYTLEQLGKFLATYKLARQPGVRSEYSNLGMGLLGNALAHKSGQSYEALVRERICQPLAMLDTCITLDDRQRSRLAPGHDYDGNPQANWDLPTLAGAGALRSTVADMLKFLSANLGLTKTSLDAALADSRAVHFKVPEGPYDVGLAWQLRRSDGMVWHNGQTGGYHSFMAFWPEKNLGVVILCNTAGLYVDRLGFELLQLVAGNDPKPLEMPRPIQLKAEDIEPLVGTYQLAPQARVTISREGEQLYLQLTGQPKVKFYPESKDRFFCRAVEAAVTFEGANGQIERLVIHQNAQDLPAPRNK